MKTLKQLPVHDDTQTMLARAENDAYIVTVRYFGRKDFSTLQYKEIQPDDLIITIRRKDPCAPDLQVLLENNKLDIKQAFLVRFASAGADFIELKYLPDFQNSLETAKETLEDIKEMLRDIVPHLIKD